MASSRRPPSRPRPATPRPARSSSQGGRYPQANAAKGSGRTAGSRTTSATWTTPGSGPLRTKIETASRTALLRMHALPRWALFLTFLGLAVGAALAPGVWGALCAVVLATFLLWLLFLAWPKLSPAARAVRLIVIAVLLGAVIAKIALG